MACVMHLMCGVARARAAREQDGERHATLGSFTRSALARARRPVLRAARAARPRESRRARSRTAEGCLGATLARPTRAACDGLRPAAHLSGARADRARGAVRHQ